MPLSLLLRCTDIEATRRFYAALPGFEIGDGDEGSLVVELRGQTLIFTALDLWQSPPLFTGTIYFSVPEVDAWHAQIAARLPLAWPLQDMPYGTREFAIRDGDGYYLAFRQQDPTSTRSTP